MMMMMENELNVSMNYYLDDVPLLNDDDVLQLQMVQQLFHCSNYLVINSMNYCHYLVKMHHQFVQTNPIEKFHLSKKIYRLNCHIKQMISFVQL